VQALAGIAFYVMVRLIERDDLLDGTAPPEILHNGCLRAAALAGNFLVSIPLAFVLGSWSYLVWMAIPDHRARLPRRPTSPRRDEP